MKVPINAPDTREEFDVFMTALMEDITEEQLSTAWDKHSKMTLAEKLVDTMNEYGESLIDSLQKQFDEKVKAEKEALEKEMVSGIRAGLGLDDNPPVHLKDLQEIVRELVLKEVEAKKKTANTDGREPEPDEEKTPFKKYMFGERLNKELSQ